MKLELTIPEPGALKGTVSFGDGDGIELKQVSQQSLVNKLGETSNPKLGILPPAVRWISANKRLVVFERPPFMGRIEYYPVKKEEITRDYKTVYFDLPLPWTVYIAYFTEDYTPVQVRVYARNSPIEDMDSQLGVLPILNLYGSGELCNPVFEKFEAVEPTLANGINAAYNTVWNSGFNYDLADAMNLGRQWYAPPGPNVAIHNKIKSLEYMRADTIGRFYGTWSRCTFEEVLNTPWPHPWSHRRAEEIIPSPMPLGTAIRLVKESTEGDFPKDAAALIVNLTNTINSL